MSYQEFITLASSTVITFMGVAGVIVFVVGFFKNWWTGFAVFKKLNKVDFEALDRTIKITNAFTLSVLPTMLQGLENKNLVEKGTLTKWTATASKGFAEAHSPRQLTEMGEKILKETGIKKIIDDNLSFFILEIEKQNPKSPLDVEQSAFYLLNNKEKTDIMVPIRTYLYNHPSNDGDPSNEVSTYTIFFVGGLYLRDKYFEKHPELIK